MGRVFRPRRGTTYTMHNTDKKNTVLAKGEFFIEVPNSGPGTGDSIIMIGDGTTTYENLPVAISGTTVCDVEESTATTVSEALSKVISGRERSILFGHLKKAVELNQSAISQVNELIPFRFAIQNGEYGYRKTDGTFTPFRSQNDIDAAIHTAMVGTAGTAQVLVGYTFTNSSSSGLTGAMPNQGTKTYTIYPGGEQEIPAGYHSGSGYVRAEGNQNTGTYTFLPNSDGSTVDLSAGNNIRFVNARNVYTNGYNTGYNEGQASVDYRRTTLWTYSTPATEYTTGVVSVPIGSTTNYDFIEVIYYRTDLAFLLAKYLGGSTDIEYAFDDPTITEDGINGPSKHRTDELALATFNLYELVNKYTNTNTKNVFKSPQEGGTLGLIGTFTKSDNHTKKGAISGWYDCVRWFNVKHEYSGDETLKFYFDNCYKRNSSTKQNKVCIPYKIKGLKINNNHPL